MGTLHKAGAGLARVTSRWPSYPWGGVADRRRLRERRLEWGMGEMIGRVGGPREEIASPAEDDEVLFPDARGGRWLRRRLAGGVLALTTAVEGKYRAVTVTAAAVVSVDPLQALVSIERESHMEEWLLASGVFGISILPWREQFLADRFAGFAPLPPTTFQGIDHFVAQTGAPLLTGCIAWMDCQVVQDLIIGDHHSFVGEVVALGRGQGNEDDPLVYYLNRYRRLQ